MLEVLGAYLQIDLGQLTLKNGAALHTLTGETQPASTGSLPNNNPASPTSRVQLPENCDAGTVVKSDTGRNSPRLSDCGADVSPNVSEASWYGVSKPF